MKIMDHPVMLDKLTALRDKRTSDSEFRTTLRAVSALIAFELTRDMATKDVAIETPLGKTQGPKLAGEIVIFPILRAGMGMIEGFLEILPNASVGQIGIYRDKFIRNTVEYYFRVPRELDDAECVLLDPIVATADTMISAIDRLKEYGAQRIRVACVLISQVGKARLESAHPDVTVFAIAVEKNLNENGYLLPGMGDVAGRLYGSA